MFIGTRALMQSIFCNSQVQRYSKSISTTTSSTEGVGCIIFYVVAAMMLFEGERTHSQETGSPARGPTGMCIFSCSQRGVQHRCAKKYLRASLPVDATASLNCRSDRGARHSRATPLAALTIRKEQSIKHERTPTPYILLLLDHGRHRSHHRYANHRLHRG